MGGDEVVDRRVVVDPRGIFEIGGLRVLVPLAKTHQRLVRPGILIEHRDFDDPCSDHRIGPAGRTFNGLHFAQDIVGSDDVGIELDLERGVGRANLGHAFDLAVAHGVGHREALEKGLQRHALVAFDEEMLVATE